MGSTGGAKRDRLARVRPGSASKRTPARQALILLALAKGHSRASAAAQAGIHRSVLYDWTNDDPAFAEAVDIAEAKAEAAVVDVLVSQLPTDWRASVAWLERRRRVEWRPPTNSTEVSGPDGGPIALDDARAKIASAIAGLADAAPSPGGPGKADPD